MNRTSHPDTTAADARKTVWMRRRRLIERGFTVAALLGVVYLGWSLIGGMQRLLQVSPAVDTASENTGVVSPAWPRLAEASLRDGRWQIGGGCWQVGMTKVDTGAIDERLDNLNAVAAAPRLSTRDREAMQSLLRAVRQLGFEESEQSDRHTYRHDGPGIRVRIVTRIHNGQEFPVVMAAAVEDPAEGVWNLYELSTAHGQAPTIDPPHLLPVPPSAQSLVSRTGDDGAYTFEMFELPQGASGLVKGWRAEGWEVARAPHAPDGQFYFLCEREQQVVYAWSPDRGRNIERVALVRVPAEMASESVPPSQTNSITSP